MSLCITFPLPLLSRLRKRLASSTRSVPLFHSFLHENSSFPRSLRRRRRRAEEIFPRILRRRDCTPAPTDRRNDPSFRPFLAFHCKASLPEHASSVAARCTRLFACRGTTSSGFDPSINNVCNILLILHHLPLVGTLSTQPILRCLLLTSPTSSTSVQIIFVDDPSWRARNTNCRNWRQEDLHYGKARNAALVNYDPCLMRVACLNLFRLRRATNIHTESNFIVERAAAVQMQNEEADNRVATQQGKSFCEYLPPFPLPFSKVQISTPLKASDSR